MVDAAGLPERLSAFDMLLHRGEGNPRTRSGIMALEILDTTPDWDRFLAVFENASRRVLRLRQKVVGRPSRRPRLAGWSTRTSTSTITSGGSASRSPGH